MTIHSSPLPDITVPEQSLTPFVFERAADRASKPALIDGTSGRTVTYADLADQVQRLAGGLHEDGLRKGETVAVLAPNCPEYAVVLLGTTLAGGVVTTVNPTYTVGEVHHQLADSGATRLVTIPSLADIANQAIDGTGVAETFLIGESNSASDSLSSLFGEPSSDLGHSSVEDIAVLPYSSGTTGWPKGVMLSHRNQVSNIVQAQAAIPVDESDTFVAVLPFFHIYGMQVLMNLGLRAGATIVTMPRFDLETFLRLSETYRTTRAFVAPPMVLALAKHPMVDKFDLSSLQTIFSGAAPLSADLASEASRRLSCEVIQGYGMTELSPVSHATPPGKFKPGSVGVTVPGTETVVVDPLTTTPLITGEDGEVWIRGPQVMKGYLNNPEATRATIDEAGWLHTGDIGHVDEDGHLFIVDRLKELIKYKGFQVAPAELEALLLTHPQVTDAAVIGCPDDEAGELPTAFVVLAEDGSVDPTELQQYTSSRLATYKHIHQFHFVAEIPKSASGKILRRVLRERLGQLTQ